MKHYCYMAAVALAFTQGTWASNPEKNDENTIANTLSLPGYPTIPEHCIHMITPASQIAYLHLNSEATGEFLDKRSLLNQIAGATGNPAEFMNHHMLPMSTLPIDNLREDLRRGEFTNKLRKSSAPAATRYYDVQRRVAGTHLSLKGLWLVFLPPVLWTNTALTDLSLQNNRIKYLPEGIGKLVNLRQLTLCNFFTPLPQTFVNLTALERLNVSPEQWDYFQDQPMLYDLQNAQRALGNRPVTVWILYENGRVFNVL